MRGALLALAACGASTPPASHPAPSAPAVAWPVPAGWRSEIIPFPLDFAPSLAHRGKEELRFPPGFFDPAAGDYWSYAFVWRLDDVAQLDAAALGAELTTYFRGLTAAVDTEHKITTPEQIVVRATGAGPSFQLAGHVFDAFKTSAPLDLTGTARRIACGAGALWVFVLAPAATSIRAPLDELLRGARC
jgi:hypothetical protein